MEIKLPQIVSIDPLCLLSVHLSIIDYNLVHNIWYNVPVYRWKEVRSLVLIKIKMSHVTSGYELYIISIEGWMYHAQHVKDAKMPKL